MNCTHQPHPRLDQALVALGFFPSRAQARAAIAAGGVVVDGVVARKPAQTIAPNAQIRATPAHPWVSRAGLKLAHALERFRLTVSGAVALDLGASTGGFTEVLLQAGARSVTAVDVGHGQFHPRLGADPRVRLLEGRDSRSLTAADLPTPPDVIVADLSFIGLLKALPPALALAAPEALLVCLIKPQFEAGPARVGRGGLVAPDLAPAIAAEVAAQLDGLCGFVQAGFAPSPIAGGDGNLEFLYLARRHKNAPDE
jgi:23S rRNA (cytidine1920-2'-O)/16S rRNA (cytidine1409-2'-O)-methyltransferase